MKNVKKMLKDQKGLSLVEIMVVLAIIAIVGGVVAVKVFEYLDESKVEATKLQMRNLKDGLGHYKRKLHNYPTSEQGLQALVEAPADLKNPKLYPRKGFIDKLPQDAWGNDFEYQSPGPEGEDFVIISLGADGAEGGDDFAEDISSADL